MKKHKLLSILLGILIAIVVIIEAGSFVVDAIVLHKMRQQLNTASPDFSGYVGSVTTHPFALSVDIKGIVIRQKDHPEPPVAELPRLHAGIQWHALLSGKLVADGKAHYPRLYVNLDNLQPVLEKMKQAPPSKVPLAEKLKQLPALTLSGVRVVNGELSVATLAIAKKPVKITKIDVTVKDLSDRPSAETYPTDIRMTADMAGAPVAMNAQANLLAEPGPALKAEFSLTGLDLTRFKDTAKLMSVNINKGTLSAKGTAEYSSRVKVVDFSSIVLEAPEINYIYVEQPAAKKPPEKKAPLPVVIQVQSLRIDKGVVGVENVSANPSYRLFVSDIEMEMKNYSTGFSRQPATVHLTGKFMDSGATLATGTFRSEAKGPDFTVNVGIKNTEMSSMNNLFRNYGKFDVSKGYFSFYSQLTVKNNKVDGYVKPLFRDMKVYDKRTEQDRNVFHDLYEKALGSVTKLLENPQGAVATKAPVKGTLATPTVGTWEALGNLLRNAFIQSILPGFTQSIRVPSR